MIPNPMLKCDFAGDQSPNGWLLNPVMNFTHYLTHEMIISGITARALMSTGAMPKYLMAAKKSLPKSGKGLLACQAIDQMIKQIRIDSDFAEEEVQRDCSTVYTHSLIGVWASFETMNEHLHIGHVLNVAASPVLMSEIHAKFRIKEGDRDSFKGAKRAVRRWQGKSDEKNAIQRLIDMLSVWGLKVELLSSDRQLLTEMSELRNLLLHNNGYVDSTFVENCPWTPLTVGDELHVGFDRQKGYFGALSRFHESLLPQVVKSQYFKSAA